MVEMTRAITTFDVATVTQTLLRAPPLPQWMTEAETSRLQFFRNSRDRESYVAAHWLAREVAGEVSGIAPSDLQIEQVCAHCGGAHGKPIIRSLPDFEASLSHSRGIVAAAFGSAPVGIDVENWREAVIDEAVISHAFTANEQRLLEKLCCDAVSNAEPGPRVRTALKIWVCKESLIKLGLLSLDTLNECDLVDIVCTGRGMLANTWLGEYQRVYFHDVSDIALGAICAVATYGRTTLRRMPRMG